VDGRSRQLRENVFQTGHAGRAGMQRRLAARQRLSPSEGLRRSASCAECASPVDSRSQGFEGRSVQDKPYS
jgi:hypothetical protein